jgi:hypothetical protein
MFRRILDWLTGGSKESGPSHARTSPPSAPREPLTAPFELVTAPGAKAAQTWAALRQRPGVVPVLFGNRECAERVLEATKFNEDSFESIRDAGLKLDVDAWIEERVSADPEYYVIDETRSGPADVLTGFTPAQDILTRKPHPEVYFGLIPVEAPWLVPAYLKFGGWNECPDAVVQLAFFRRWFDRYGAVVTTVADDIIEFHVARPPATPEAALQLAREQYIYCADIVDQGVETVGNLAAALERSPAWYFWWD